MPAGLEPETIGPVDVALIVFEGSEFAGDVAPALADLHESGTVRVIDRAFVRKEADGTTSFVEVGDADVADKFERVDTTEFDLLSDEDLTELASGLEPSTSAMVIVWENSWAARFGAAVRGSHGHVASLERVPRENVLRALAALDET